MESIDNTAARLISSLQAEHRRDIEVLALLETEGIAAALGVGEDVREAAIRLLRSATSRELALSLGAMEVPDTFEDVCAASEQDANCYVALARG